MMVSCVVDPSGFSAAPLRDPLQRAGARAFLRGILRNGVILSDPKGRLQADMCQEVKDLPSSLGQDLKTLLAEILKTRHRHLFTCKTLPLTETDYHTRRTLIRRVMELTAADGIVTDRDGHGEFLQAGVHGGRVVPLHRYEESYLEQARDRFIHDPPLPDRIPDAEFDDLIARFTRFSPWLRFYDKPMGKAKGPEKFREGIDRIVRVWKSRSQPLPLEGITLVTCGSANRRTTAGEVIDKIARPIARAHQVPVSLWIKRDPDRIFHARHLESCQAVVRFDVGFMLFDENMRRVRNLLTIENPRRQHLRECLALQNAFHPVLIDATGNSGRLVPT
jgi:hypothetical protein